MSTLNEVGMNHSGTLVRQAAVTNFQEDSMGMIKSALKTGIAVKIVDVVRREAAKPENQRKAREMVDRVRREATKPENQRKARDLAAKFSSRSGKRHRMP
ncbi:hypothetical protein BH24ACT9_BH24ACT9_09050 [soil metagenome]